MPALHFCWESSSPCKDSAINEWQSYQLPFLSIHVQFILIGIHTHCRLYSVLSVVSQTEVDHGTILPPHTALPPMSFLDL